MIGLPSDGNVFRANLDNITEKELQSLVTVIWDPPPPVSAMEERLKAYQEETMAVLEADHKEAMEEATRRYDYLAK